MSTTLLPLASPPEKAFGLLVSTLPYPSFRLGLRPGTSQHWTTCSEQKSSSCSEIPVAATFPGIFVFCSSPSLPQNPNSYIYPNPRQKVQQRTLPHFQTITFLWQSPLNAALQSPSLLLQSAWTLTWAPLNFPQLWASTGGVLAAKPHWTGSLQSPPHLNF